MVLAAGLGTRLGPLTADRAKPAVPFLGTPVVRTLVAQLADVGCHPIVVNLHYMPDSVRGALNGLPVKFSMETDILGTAGGIGQALASGLLSRDEPLLVANGKISTDIDVRILGEHHRAAGADATMTLVPNRKREAFREVFVAGDRVTGFGRTREPESSEPLSFTGIQVLSPRVLADLRPVSSDTVRDVFPPLIERGTVAAFVTEARWWEFSTPERYLGLHLAARRRGWTDDELPRAGIRETVVWDGACIAAGARLERCIVVSGVTVGAGTVADHRIFAPEAPGGGGLREVQLDPSAVSVAAAS